VADPEELIEAKRLAAAILRQALDDYEQVADRAAGLRSRSRNSDCLKLTYTDRREIEDWLFSDRHLDREIVIDGNETSLSETQGFRTPLMAQRLVLEQDSSGQFSFHGCCALLSMDAYAVRRKLRQWMNRRESGEYLSLVAKPVAAAKRAKAAMRIRQAETWKRSGYPQPVVEVTFGRALAGPPPSRKPIPPDVRQRQEAAVLRLTNQGVDRQAVALRVGISRDRVRSILRRAKRARDAQQTLLASA
jgi:DNA-binding CsgD family transcriptional regulator